MELLLELNNAKITMMYLLMVVTIANILARKNVILACSVFVNLVINSVGNIIKSMVLVILSVATII